MSNLSELLPTGGGQNAVDFVASGTLSSGQTVALKADGTVEAVSSSGGLGTEFVFESAASNDIVSVFDSANNKIVIAYRDEGNSNYGTAVVGTISGSSISFGTPSLFNGAYTNQISAAYDSNAQKIVIAYRNNANNYGYAIVGSVSGTSISFGSPAIFEAANTSIISIIYHSNQQQVVIAYQDQGNSSYGTAIVGVVTGTSIGFYTPSVFNSAGTGPISATYDSFEQKVVISYRNYGNSFYGEAIVGTVASNAITFGSSTTFQTDNTSIISSTYDSSAQKIIVAYMHEGGDLYYGSAIIGSVSGSSISFGSSVVFSAGNTGSMSPIFDSANNKVLIASYKQTGQLGLITEGTISGTSISFGLETTFNSGGVTGMNQFASAYDSVSEKMIVAYRDGANLNYGTAITYAPLSTNSASFIGITASAIADTATGAVNIYGGINEAQTGLTIGSDYYVQADGSLSTTASDVKVGKAISATTINMMDLT